MRTSDPNSILIGYDSGFFGQCLTAADVLPERYLDAQYFGDVRDLSSPILEGVDAVVHLAAVSNDPIGNQFEAVTHEVNQQASVRAAELARDAGVRNFVFASSCSVYGAAGSGARREEDALSPLTAYARSKVGTERALEQLNLGSMVVTCLRFGTACGMSPRLRLDLVLNDFVACALAQGEITVLSDGTPWRPLIDVRDMARAIGWAVSCPANNGGQYPSLNVGSDDRNFQIKHLAEAVAKQIPAKVSINTSAQPDTRSYRVDFARFKSLAPAYQPQVTLGQSIAMLKQGLQQMGFADTNFRDSAYMRLKVLQTHIAAGLLAPTLRWTREIAGHVPRTSLSASI